MLYITNLKGKTTKIDDWKSIKEPIVGMAFKINSEQLIVMEGFKSYIRIKEEFKGVNCDINGISKILLIGKVDDKVAIITINIQKNKITKAIKLASKVYKNKPLISPYWKKGVFNKPRVYVQKI